MTTQLDSTELAVADADALRVETAAMDVSLGIAPAAFGQPRPELNGLRVKVPEHSEIYLVDQGYRRWIPNPETYNNLFRDWNGIREDTGVTDIATGTPVADGAILARASGTAPVYFVDGGVKRWVTSQAAMDKYNFSWARVYEVPPILLQWMPFGPSIS